MRDPTNAPTDDDILSFQGHGDSPFFSYYIRTSQ